MTIYIFSRQEILVKKPLKIVAKGKCTKILNDKNFSSSRSGRFLKFFSLHPSFLLAHSIFQLMLCTSKEISRRTKKKKDCSTSNNLICKVELFPFPLQMSCECRSEVSESSFSKFLFIFRQNQVEQGKRKTFSSLVSIIFFDFLQQTKTIYAAVVVVSLRKVSDVLFDLLIDQQKFITIASYTSTTTAHYRATESYRLLLSRLEPGTIPL